MDRLQLFGETLKNHSMNVAGMRFAFWGWEGGGDLVFNGLSKGFTAHGKVKNIQGVLIRQRSAPGGQWSGVQSPVPDTASATAGSPKDLSAPVCLGSQEGGAKAFLNSLSLHSTCTEASGGGSPLGGREKRWRGLPLAALANPG